MSETETSPVPFSEQTVEPNNLYQDVKKFLQKNAGPQSVADIQRALRPSTSKQKFYYTIDGMVECGALIRTHRGVSLAPQETIQVVDACSWLPKQLHFQPFQDWIDSLSLDDMEAIRTSEGLASISKVRTELLKWILLTND